MAKRKYDHLFTTDLHYQNTYPPKKAMMFYGLDDEKNHFQIRFTHISLPFEGLEPAHKHDFDEVFAFVPCSDDVTAFDGEAELCLGEEGEVYKINQTTVVHVPGGLVHCPIRHIRVGTPYFFVNCVMSAEYTRFDKGKKVSMGGMGLPKWVK